MRERNRVEPWKRPTLFIKIFLFFTLLSPILSCGQVKLDSGGEESSPDFYSPVKSLSTPWSERRSAFQTKRIEARSSWHEFEPSWENEFREAAALLPGKLELVTYPSGPLTLKAGLYVPEEETNGEPAKHPALVYLHGGFSLSVEDLLSCYEFIEAGFVVMAPAYRGENGLPGKNELFLGEVDDAAAAARWLAKRPEVDPERIYAFGHSAGGGIAALLSLVDDVPLVHAGSSGGLYSAETFQEWKSVGVVPFDPTDLAECQNRILIGNVRWMKRPHWAYVGSDDDGCRAAAEILEAEAGSEGKSDLLKIKTIPGDHFESLDGALSDYLREIRREESAAGAERQKQIQANLKRMFHRLDAGEIETSTDVSAPLPE